MSLVTKQQRLYHYMKVKQTTDKFMYMAVTDFKLSKCESHLRAIDLHLQELCTNQSQVWTWFGGEGRGGQFVIIWVTTCLTDTLLLWPLFVLWTDNKTVCVRGERGEKMTWWGEQETLKRKPGLYSTVPDFSKTLASCSFWNVYILDWFVVIVLECLKFIFHTKTGL